MTLNRPDLPPIINDLIDTLEARGFARVSVREGGMGGFQVILRGPSLNGSGPCAEVALRSDRGSWDATLRFDGMRKYIDPRIWATRVLGEPIGEPDITQAAQFIANNIDDAAALAEKHPRIDDELYEIGKRYMVNRRSRPSQ